MTTYAGTTANEFFRLIGHQHLQAVTCLRIDISNRRPDRIVIKQQNDILSFMAVLTEYLPQTQHFEDLTLSFEPNPIQHRRCGSTYSWSSEESETSEHIARTHPKLCEEKVHYVLAGLRAHPLIAFVFPHRQDLSSPRRIQRTDLRALNRFFIQNRKKDSLLL